MCMNKKYLNSILLHSNNIFCVIFLLLIVVVKIKALLTTTDVFVKKKSKVFKQEFDEQFAFLIY